MNSRPSNSKSSNGRNLATRSRRWCVTAIGLLAWSCSDGTPIPTEIPLSEPPNVAQDPPPPAFEPAATDSFDPPAARRLTAEAMQSGDDPALTLELLDRALSHRPNYLDPLLLRAGAALAAGDRDAALSSVTMLTSLGHDLPLSQDPRLENLWQDPGFQKRIEEQDARSQLSQIRSTPAFRLEERDLIPESVVYDSRTGAFYISSVRHRKIIRRSPEGEVRDFIGPGKDDELFFSMLGLSIDVERRHLWAITAALPQMVGYREEWKGRSALLQIDLDHGEILGRWEPAASPETPFQLNDIAVAANGTVYASSTLVPGAIFRLPATSHGQTAHGRAADGQTAHGRAADGQTAAPQDMEIFGEPGLRSPQGLAVSEDGKTLFVADYSYGIAAYRIPSGERIWLREPEGFFLSGIDGLTRVGSDLIAIQNGVRPHRVLRLKPDLAQAGFSFAEVLEQGHPEHSEPTLGTEIQDKDGTGFLYVANSQWDRFDQDQRLPATEDLAAPLFLRLPLSIAAGS